MMEEAIVELENACTCSGNHPSALAAFVHALAIAGRKNEAGESLEQLKRVSSTRHVSPYWLSIAYTALEEWDDAFESLSKAREERDAWLVWLNVEPRFDPLRNDARFTDLLRHIGL
jgi:serine/threonine-protein kinase